MKVQRPGQRLDLADQAAGRDPPGQVDVPRSAISRLERSAAHLADSTIIRAEIGKMLASP
jgi:hypothetical protein